MSRNMAILLAAGGSLALLLGAWGFQYIGGLAPCKMCLWQRWPHIGAVAVGVLAYGVHRAELAVVGALLAASSGVIGIYHTGVERGWWQGPSTCSGGSEIGAMSPEDLLAEIMEAPLVRCDEVAWQMLGLSMASWNALISFALAGLWLYAATRPKPV